MDFNELSGVEWVSDRTPLEVFRVRIWDSDGTRSREREVRFLCRESCKEYVRQLGRFTRRKIQIV